MPKAISLEKKDAVVINKSPTSGRVNAHPWAGDGWGCSCPAWVLHQHPEHLSSQTVTTCKSNSSKFSGKKKGFGDFLQMRENFEPELQQDCWFQRRSPHRHESYPALSGCVWGRNCLPVSHSVFPPGQGCVWDDAALAPVAFPRAGGGSMGWVYLKDCGG